MEPSAAEAVREVAANPDWLDLTGQRLVVLGAGAEMGPLRAVLSWGGEVVGVDLPRPDVWKRVLETARGSAGTLHVPVPHGSDVGAQHLEERAGADLLHDLPRIADWLTGLAAPLVLGNYVYADGATNMRVAMAVDTLTQELLRRRDDVALAFLATPTDVFAVPAEAVDHSTRGYRSPSAGMRLARPALRALSGGRLLRRNYAPGSDPGLNDSLVPQQGPNYALAKRLQRWRATTARDHGVAVSLNVAPPTRTRSVVKNRALAVGLRRRPPLRHRGVRARHEQHAHGGPARARPPLGSPARGLALARGGPRRRARRPVAHGIRPAQRAGAGRGARSGLSTHLNPDRP